MIVDLLKKLRRSHPRRDSRLPLPVVRPGRHSRETADHSVKRLPEPASHLRRSKTVSSAGAILPPVPRLPHIADHSSYWRKLETDPAFAAEMSERQRRIGNY